MIFEAVLDAARLDRSLVGYAGSAFLRCLPGSFSILSVPIDFRSDKICSGLSVFYKAYLNCSMTS